MNIFTTPSHQPTRRTRNAAASLAVLTSLLFAAAACSSSDGRTSSSVATTSTAVATTSTSAVAPTTSPPSTTPPSTTPPSSTSPSTLPDAAEQSVLTGILESHRAAGEFVGARIALLDAAGNITEAVAGTTTIDPTSDAVSLDTPWNVGSVTKTFVAVVALQLADEGRLDLDAGIESFVPDLADAASITPRQLLQHTSGLGEYNDKPAVLSDSRRVWSAPELIAVAEAGGRFGAPGAAYHYSNTNYAVLGQIIERITGTSWSEQVRERIVVPLGLTSTGLLTAPLPVGYQLVDGAFVDTTSSTDPSVAGSAGGLQSTGRDLLRFASALFGGSLLSDAGLEAMESFIPGDDLSQFGITHSYGLGLEQYASASVTIIGHMGTGEAQSAFLGYDREHGTAVAVMTNTAYAGPQAFMALEALTAVSQ